MKKGHYVIIVLIAVLSQVTPAFTQDIIRDINSILQIEDSEEKKVAENKEENIPVRKRIISRYSEDNLPRARDFVDAFKIAVEIIFGEKQEDTALDNIRNAAYMIKGTSAFVVNALDYCMKHQYLGRNGIETKEMFLEKNNVALTNADLVFSKTKPLTQKEQRVLQIFTDKAIAKEFQSIDSCIRHDYQVKRGVFTLSTYDKTKGYVDIVNAFLRTE